MTLTPGDTTASTARRSWFQRAPTILSPHNLFPPGLFLEPSPTIYFSVVDIHQSNCLHLSLPVVKTHPPSDQLPQMRHGCFGCGASAQEFCGTADSIELDVFDHECFVHIFSFAIRSDSEQQLDQTLRAPMMREESTCRLPRAARSRALCDVCSPKYNEFGRDGRI